MIERRIPDLTIYNESIRVLSGLNPVRSLTALLAEWLIIVLAIAIHIRFPNPIIYSFVWLLIGSRMYALYSLLHDGIHYLLYPERQVNDWISKLLLAWPLFFSLKGIRKKHLAHHQYLKTDGDPEAVHLKYREFQFPKTNLEIAAILLMDITGINFIYYRMRKLFYSIRRLTGSESNYYLPVKFEAGIMAYYIIIFLFIIYFRWELQFLLYWFIPYITVYQALNRLRLSTEHFQIPDDKILQTRTVRLSFIESFFFSPHNLGFHAEHHLYPRVPFHRLPALHRILMKNPLFQNNVMVNTSYLDVIKRYIK